MKNKKNILLVDDEQDILDLLQYNLKKENYNIETALDGFDALLKVDHSFDLIILDVMMPKMSGFELCEKLKSHSVTQNIPIIFLTAKSTTKDELEGLKLGADDFISKPISIENLLLRIKNIFKRYTSTENELLINFKNFFINYKEMKVFNKKNIDLKLTKTEFDVLNLFVKSKGKVFSRDEIINRVRGDNIVITDRSVDVYIANLRKKIAKNIILTSHGRGYYFNEES